MVRCNAARPTKAVRAAGRLCRVPPGDRAPVASARNAARRVPEVERGRQACQGAALRDAAQPVLPLQDRTLADPGVLGEFALREPGGVAVFAQALAEALVATNRCRCGEGR